MPTVLANLTGDTLAHPIAGSLPYAYQSPGLSAVITEVVPAPATIDQLLTNAGMTVLNTHQINPLGLRSFPLGLTGTHATSSTLKLSVQQTDPNTRTLVLKTDLQTGAHRWVLPSELTDMQEPPNQLLVTALASIPTASSVTAPATRLFAIPLSTLSPPSGIHLESLSTLGLTGVIGKFLVRIISYVVPQDWIEDGAALAMDAIVRKWEESNRPYQMLHVSVAANGVSTSLMSAADYAAIQGGRALLFIHGTFSTFDGGYGSISGTDMSVLAGKYPGGIFAFNHPTMIDDPDANLNMFFGDLEKAGVKEFGPRHHQPQPRRPFGTLTGQAGQPGADTDQDRQGGPRRHP